ncbi:hypothetical protein YPPY60_0311, partial [Yersinia pestis PY-60]|jgi:hypothetical protein
MARR